MKRRSSFLLLCIVAFIFSKGQTAVSYNDYIAAIRENYPIANKANNIKAQGKLLLNAARGNYDPTINSSYENKFYNSKNYFSVLHAELKQPIFTNQYISAGIDYGQGNYLDPSNITSVNGTPYIGMEASLLQGLLIDKRRAEVLKAKHYQGYYNAESNQMMNEILYDASESFVDLVYAKKEINLYEYFLKLAEKRFVGLVVLSYIGERPAVDTIESSLLYQTRLLDYQSVLMDNRKQQNEVLSLSWKGNLVPTAFDTTLFIKDSLEYYYSKSMELLEKEMQNDLITNPIVDKYVQVQKILNVEKRLKAEMIKPKLDVKYNFLSTNSNPYSTDYSINNYKWGAKLSMPIFLRTARNEYKIAKLNVQNNSYDIANKSNELELKLKLIQSNIKLLAEQINTAERNVNYSKQLVEAEKLKFDNGESSLFLLNTRETKWLESELKLAAYRTKFIKLVFQLVYVKGTNNYLL